MVITPSLLWADWRPHLYPSVTQHLMSVIELGYVALDVPVPHKAVLQVNAEDLADAGITPQEARLAVRALRRAPPPEYGRRRPALSGDILAYLRPPRKVEDLADEGTQLIMGAIARFGYMQAKGAEGYLGEVVWTVVTRLGGWTHLCSATPEGCTTTKAQLKKSLTAAYRQAEAAEVRASLVGRRTADDLQLAKSRAPGPEGLSSLLLKVGSPAGGGA